MMTNLSASLWRYHKGVKWVKWRHDMQFRKPSEKKYFEVMADMLGVKLSYAEWSSLARFQSKEEVDVIFRYEVNKAICMLDNKIRVLADKRKKADADGNNELWSRTSCELDMATETYEFLKTVQI